MCTSIVSTILYSDHLQRSLCPMGVLSVFASIGSSILLFCLVFGMSATVELKQLRKQARNWKALLVGIGMQFVLLPFFGFLMVKVFDLDSAVGVTLMVITSSPGGSYSNWWCSLFNAELSLSVTMTALSTLLSTVMLPANLVLYTRGTFSKDVMESLDWTALLLSLAVVLSGITCGLCASARATSNPEKSPHFHRRANWLGNSAGLLLISLSIGMSTLDTHAHSNLLSQRATFYFGVGLPACFGLLVATYLTTKLNLEKPERVAVTVESCYQNTGIATSVAITMFSNNDSDLARAVGVPLFYGIVEAVILGFFCLVCWKRGWTKAPADESICTVLFNSYEVQDEQGDTVDNGVELASSKKSETDEIDPEGDKELPQID